VFLTHLQIQYLDPLQTRFCQSGGNMSSRIAGAYRLAALGIAALLVLLIAGAAACGSNGNAGGAAVAWLQDVEEAFLKAETENKPLMINFFSNTCPACDYLDSRTFSDQELGAFVNSNFVPLKSNVSESSLHNNYGVPALPTTLLADPSGTEMGRIVGYVDAGRFYQEVQAILKRW